MTDAVQALIDKDEISSVILAYARAQDRLDSERMFAAYHDDAIEDHGVVLGITPVSEFIPWGIEYLTTRHVSHSHIVTGICIELDGDKAQVESRVQHTHVYRPDEHGKTRIGTGSGRYLDWFERRPGVGWRIAKRKWVHDWSIIRDDVTPEYEPDPADAGSRSRQDPTYFGLYG